MDPESETQSRESRLKAYKATLCLAYQSFGVVYGDLSISPIYVYTNTFSGRSHLEEEDDEILGVLSLIFWTLTLIPLCKYIIFVLGADDNGEGGTFALYSLLCRNSEIGLLNNSSTAQEHLSAYNRGKCLVETKTSSVIQQLFEKYQSSRIVLFLFVLLGTSMVIGDGILTPTMSVLSAVYGVKIKVPHLHENLAVFLACLVLVALFALQHYGTRRVGFLFAPILIVWLLSISGIGIYNLIHWNPSVIRALSPYYAYNFFAKAGRAGWSSLGGIVLCITGAEAMFADLGHFSQLSIKLAFTVVVYPCLILAYMGEAAYLSKHKEDIQRSFYRAIPEPLFWPVFIIATLATTVGSQAIISATFSIISQCRALNCFPRVKIIHISSQIHGQIYIPEVNWILMVFCLAIVIGFRDTNTIGNAYGLAVITVMFVTTCLMFLVIITVWRRSVLIGALFVVGFGSMELLYFSACLAKVHKGGWLPLLLSLLMLTVMCIWHYGTSKKKAFESQNRVCLERLLSLGPSLGIVRVPGIGLIYTDITTGVAPMFSHFVTNFPAFHQILMFVSLHSMTIPKVPASERFLISRIGPPEFQLFRCVIRYGYKDARKDSYCFENELILKVAVFLQHESDDGSGDGFGQVQPLTRARNHPLGQAVDLAEVGPEILDEAERPEIRFRGMGMNKEVKELVEAREAGVAYMMGQTCVKASKSSSLVKKFAIDFVYGFLRQNCRRPALALGIPHTSLIEVGMVYHV